MSNMVDILVVGGPHDGVVLCQPRGVPAVIVHEGTSYVHATHERVHVARFDPFDDSDVDAAVAASGLTPSWDLPA